MGSMSIFFSCLNITNEGDSSLRSDLQIAAMSIFHVYFFENGYWAVKGVEWEIIYGTKF